MNNLFNKKKTFSYSVLLIIFLVQIFTFKEIFSNSFLSAGDNQYYFKEALNSYSKIPLAWNKNYSNIGGNSLNNLWNHIYYLIPSKLSMISGFGWELIEKIVWILPILFFSLLSSYKISKKFLDDSIISFSLTYLIFGLNTYFLMIYGGGQKSIAFSYSFLPLVFLSLIKLIETPSFYQSLISGLLMAVTLSFDPRFLFIAVLWTIFYWTYYLLSIGKLPVLKGIFYLSISFLVMFLIHSYWIIPKLLTHTYADSLGSLTDINWITFLSFTDFSKSLSLLHPNWPENIFGKTYFMKPEFIIIPITAFSSLLFSKKNKIIIFFALSAIFGAFLAKGTNPPLGGIYRFLFDNFPGFSFFRDSTKFYCLTAISYSILIPFALYHLREIIIKKSKYIGNIIPLLFTLYFLILIMPSWTGKLSGMFKGEYVPEEYIKLKNFITKNPSLIRSFWIPSVHRYGFYNDIYPAISAENFFETNDPLKISKILKTKEKELEYYNVKYVIIPYDSNAEMFLTDRKYDHLKRKKVEEELKKITWLKKVEGFNKISVFEVKNPKGYFWLNSEKGTISIKMINSTKYQLKLDKIEKNDKLIFSEPFDPNWEMQINGNKIDSKKAVFNLNSFELPESLNSLVTIEFTPQRIVNKAFIISIISLIITITVLIYLKIRR